MTNMHRRQALTNLGAAGLALGLPLPALAAPTSRKPPRLRAGDRVSIVAPAGFYADGFDFQLVTEAITAMGLVPVPGSHWKDRFGYLAGTDRDRAADFNAAFADPTTRAVLAMRGGWGSQRILPLLDWKTIAANPKLLVGFSDITALHLAIQARAGFPTIHGPTAGSSWSKVSYAAFRDLAFDGKLPTYRNTPGDQDRLVQRQGRYQTLRPGKASGKLLGGNLTVLTSLVGTPWLPDFSGAILFLEDTDEAPYRIDRMLTQIGQAGILRRVAGVVFGQCTNCKPSDGSTSLFTLNEVFDQHLKPLGVPVYTGAMFGHIEDQFSLPVGCRAEIDADAGTIRLLEAPVA
ncbi:S66 peptidase family protein [Sphingomonas glaciei]|uniref:LD-carboxypeptidase n=1 Tax=Sphingomonas glaciei TaxID=2938948 RepID=A0ABY5MU83_9SPHN|nr:LD-carboxypeptidase [Sphingomonas glaciei]UUR06887.1 LD-carboxypeptidase [Sphingomonas glaciei]